MDEPSEGLAPLIVRELGNVIDALKSSGTAVLLVEQQLRFALRHADRIYIMSKGRVVHHCTPPRARRRRRHPLALSRRLEWEVPMTGLEARWAEFQKR